MTVGGTGDCEPRFGSFYGQILRRRELPHLTLTETRYPPHFAVPPHSHERPWFGFVLDGYLKERYAKRSVECRPQTLLFRCGSELHADQFYDSGGRCLTVEVGQGFLNWLNEHSRIWIRPTEFQGGLLAALAVRLYNEFHNTDEVSALAVEGLTFELLAEAYRYSGAVSETNLPSWLPQARDLIHAHFSENLTLLGIAQSVGVHPVHLARVFRRSYRCTVGEYVRKLRVTFAYQRIAESDSPLAEIALAAGFYDQAHFSKAFKCMTGVSPGRLRRVLRSC